MVKLNKGSILIITETIHTTKLHGTSTRRCNNKAIFSDRVIFTFPTVTMWVFRSFALSPLDGASVHEAHCEQASTAVREAHCAQATVACLVTFEVEIFFRDQQRIVY